MKLTPKEDCILRSETGVPQEFGYRPECPRKQKLLQVQKAAAGTYDQTPFVCTYNTEYRASTGSRQSSFRWACTYRIIMFFRVEELLELWMGVEENCLLFLLRAIATDAVACRKNKEVSDPAVALCQRTSRLCLQFVRVCSVR